MTGPLEGTVKNLLLFQAGPDVYLDAHVGGWLSDDHRYTTAFAQAADVLVRQTVIEGGASPDAYFYPAIFLYRHAIEISLKENIRDAEELCDLPAAGKGLDATHNLLKLLARLAQSVAKLVVDPLPEEMRATIAELGKFDPNGERFRFPTQKRAGPSFNETEHFDLQGIAKRLKAAHSMLHGGVGGALSAMLDARSEEIRGMRDLHGRERE